jgi:hypothetical protein
MKAQLVSRDIITEIRAGQRAWIRGKASEEQKNVKSSRWNDRRLNVK